MDKPTPNLGWERLIGLLTILSPGGWIIVLLALGSTVGVAFWPVSRSTGLEMWTFARPHYLMYEPLVQQWNQDHLRQPVNLYLFSGDALARRMMSGFLSNTPLADLLEVERSQVGRVFAGPLEDVGFVDLTDRLHQDGLDKEINAPSFSPWISRGRVFGLPHDVHPVLLAYRADLVEAAGIDISQVETWDDFVRIFRPLIRDLDGDGLPDRYLLNLWYTATDYPEILLLQAGGNYFDAQDRLVMASDISARVIATVVSWTTGPGRIAADAPEFSASGNQLRLQGFVVASFMPDWLAGAWKLDLPQLAGRVKLMPLPAWEKGGRRTSVWGGTMLGLTKSTRQVEASWQFAKELYLSERLACELYRTTNIITPVKRFWPSSYYDAPDPYFCGQAPGRMFIQQAPDVPRRTSSPYYMLAKARLGDALMALRQYAVDHQCYDVGGLQPEARRLLQAAEVEVQRQMKRNVFLREQQP